MPPHHILDAGNRGGLGASIAEENERGAIRLGLVERAPRPIAGNNVLAGDTFIHGS